MSIPKPYCIYPLNFDLRGQHKKCRDTYWVNCWYRIQICRQHSIWYLTFTVPSQLAVSRPTITRRPKWWVSSDLLRIIIEFHSQISITNAAWLILNLEGNVISLSIGWPIVANMAPMNLSNAGQRRIRKKSRKASMKVKPRNGSCKTSPTMWSISKGCVDYVTKMTKQKRWKYLPL